MYIRRGRRRKNRHRLAFHKNEKEIRNPLKPNLRISCHFFPYKPLFTCNKIVFFVILRANRFLIGAREIKTWANVGKKHSKNSLSHVVQYTRWAVCIRRAFGQRTNKQKTTMNNKNNSHWNINNKNQKQQKRCYVYSEIGVNEFHSNFFCTDQNWSIALW